MIRPLRRQHRLMIVVLSVALAILFIASFLVRPKSQTTNKVRFDRVQGSTATSGVQQ